MILDGLIRCFSEALFCNNVSEPIIHPNFSQISFLRGEIDCWTWISCSNDYYVFDKNVFTLIE